MVLKLRGVEGLAFVDLLLRNRLQSMFLKQPFGSPSISECGSLSTVLSLVLSNFGCPHPASIFSLSKVPASKDGALGGKLPSNVPAEARQTWGGADASKHLSPRQLPL
jgi:hypothetical protein